MQSYILRCVPIRRFVVGLRRAMDDHWQIRRPIGLRRHDLQIKIKIKNRNQYRYYELNWSAQDGNMKHCRWRRDQLFGWLHEIRFFFVPMTSSEVLLTDILLSTTTLLVHPEEYLAISARIRRYIRDRVSVRCTFLVLKGVAEDIFNSILTTLRFGTREIATISESEHLIIQTWCI